MDVVLVQVQNHVVEVEEEDVEVIQLRGLIVTRGIDDYGITWCKGLSALASTNC